MERDQTVSAASTSWLDFDQHVSRLGSPKAEAVVVDGDDAGAFPERTMRTSQPGRMPISCNRATTSGLPSISTIVAVAADRKSPSGITCRKERFVVESSRRRFVMVQNPVRRVRSPDHRVRSVEIESQCR